MFGSAKREANIVGSAVMPGGGDAAAAPARSDNAAPAPEPAAPAALGAAGGPPPVLPGPRPKSGLLLVGKYNQGRIHVEIQNLTQKEIVVGPKNLAIAASGGKQVFPFEDYAPGLAITRLRPGDQVVGYLGVGQLKPLNAAGGQVRPGPETLKGARLLFQHPDVGMVVTNLRPDESISVPSASGAGPLPVQPPAP